jgi:hypothetical protein
MATNYITITESGTGALSKRFRAIQMTPTIRATKNIRETVGGDYDISYGANFESYRYVLRVPYTGTDTDGSYSDIKTMLRRNNPSGAVPPTFTFTDHYGTVHNNARFGGDNIDIEPLTTMIDGATGASSYLIPVTILLAPGDTI